MSTDITDTAWAIPKKTPPSTLQAIPKPIRPLTRKQQAFIKQLVDNPKQSATQAVKQVYNTTTDNSASQIATENLSKPQIMLELSKHSNTAELTVLNVMKYSTEYGRNDSKQGASYASVALQSANSILDRLHGKATQKTEVQSTSLTLSIDLTGTFTPIE